MSETKKYKDMTLEELRKEEAHWNSIIDNATGWGGHLAAANEFLKECRSWIARRENKERGRASPTGRLSSPEPSLQNIPVRTEEGRKIREALSTLLVVVGETPRGYTIFREPNGVGGHRYWSDEIGGGVCVWDTSLVAIETLRTCIALEVPSADKAEIERLKFERNDLLAAELRARLRVESAEARVRVLENLVNQAIGIFTHCTVSDGVCCCGDAMDKHAEPMSCGHSPVDHGGYAADQWMKSAALAAQEKE